MSPQLQALTLDREIVKRVGLHYLLWQPAEDITTPAAWPLILFLHGRGERGTDLALVTRYGLPQRLQLGFELPAFVVAPQCPSSSDWTLEDDALLALLDELTANYPIDPDRIYLTGLSMGARGTWRLAALNPHRFAALVPICGRRPDGVRDAGDVQPLCELPIWVFHGAQDEVVPVSESDAIVTALQARGGNVRYTVYPDAGHDSWTPAYAEPELYAWLFAQRRPTAV